MKKVELNPGLSSLIKPHGIELRSGGGIILPSGASISSPILSSSSTVSTITGGRDYGAELHARLGEKGKAEFKDSLQVLQLDEFYNEVLKDPVKHLRNFSWYLLDCVDYWDKYAREKLGWDLQDKVSVMGEEVRPYAFIRKPWLPEGIIDKECVQGQLPFWNEFLKRVRIISRKRHPNKQIIVHGPNATGKSRVFETLFQALEEYSKTPEGANYTYFWVFGDSNNFGFGQNKDDGEKVIKPEDIVASIPAGKNAHPIFLYPLEVRVELKKQIDQLKKQGKVPHDFNTDYILLNEMNSLSERLFEALKNGVYEGDTKKVYNHIHCLRWFYSAKNRRGLVLQQPYITDKAELVVITPNRDWTELPSKIRNAIATAGIHELEGDIPSVNHGLYLEDDVFKDGRPQTHLDKLRFVEKGRMTIRSNSFRDATRGVDEQFDILSVGTTNDDTLMAVQNYEEWDSLKSRFFLIPMGFERCYKNIAEVFRPNLEQFIPQLGPRHAHESALQDFALLVTMTYLFPPQNYNYYNSLKDIPSNIKEEFVHLITKKMEILHKALIYQGEDPNSYEVDPKIIESSGFKRKHKDWFERYKKFIKDEFNLGVGRHRFFFYEGSIGLPCRVAESIFEAALDFRRDECFTSIDLFEYLEDEIKHGFEYEKKRAELFSRAGKRIKELQEGKDTSISKEYIPVVPDKLPSVGNLLEQVVGHRKRKTRFDLYRALGCIRSEEEQLQNVRKYAAHAMAYTDKEEVERIYQITPGESTPSEEFMRDLERIFNTGLKDDDKEKRDKFRAELTRKITSWARENNKIGSKIFEDLGECNFILELLDELNKNDIISNQVWAYEFYIDLKNYFLVRDEKSYEEFAATYKPFKLGEAEGRRERFEKAIAALCSEEMGYCVKCFPRYINFAFKNYDFPYVEKEKKDSHIGSTI